MEKSSRKVIRDESHIQVQLPIIIDAETFPKMYDDDSVSTFHRKDTHPSTPSIAPSTTFTPVIVSNPPSVIESSTTNSKPKDIDYQEDDESVSKLSDTQSRISTLKTDIKHLNLSFHNALNELKLQSKKHEEQQLAYKSSLNEILSLLKQPPTPSDDSLIPSAQDNPPVSLTLTGGSSGAAGSG
jgi:hypothetical protein